MKKSVSCTARKAKAAPAHRAIAARMKRRPTKFGKSNRELNVHLLHLRPFDDGLDRSRWGAIVADREPLVKTLLCHSKQSRAASLGGGMTRPRSSCDR